MTNVRLLGDFHDPPENLFMISNTLRRDSNVLFA